MAGQFGIYVAIVDDGDTIVIGALGAGTGAVYASSGTRVMANSWPR